MEKIKISVVIRTRDSVLDCISKKKSSKLELCLGNCSYLKFKPIEFCEDDNRLKK
jgi:hypothetical protein